MRQLVTPTKPQVVVKKEYVVKPGFSMSGRNTFWAGDKQSHWNRNIIPLGDAAARDGYGHIMLDVVSFVIIHRERNTEEPESFSTPAE